MRITAELARDKTDYEINKISKNQIDMIESKIMECILKGNYYCIINRGISQSVKEELISRGFDVDSYKTGGYTISW